MNIIGDTEGKDILLVDDLIDTAGTFVGAIKTLKQKGAKKIFGAVTHPMLSGSAVERLNQSDLDLLFVMDTLKIKEDISPKIKVVSASELFAEALVRTYNNESISSLFNIDKG
jgi:ribose-phosphate pyrophosphokinase